MSAEIIVEFCAVVAADSELQSRLKSALAAGADESVTEFVTVAKERGFNVSDSDVLETFAAERDRRQQLDDDEYGETRIQRNEDDNIPPGIAGLRTVAISGDWNVGGTVEESDSVFE